MKEFLNYDQTSLQNYKLFHKIHFQQTSYPRTSQLIDSYSRIIILQTNLTPNPLIKILSSRPLDFKNKIILLMSLSPESEFEHNLLAEQSLENCRKKSDSTLQMAEPSKYKSDASNLDGSNQHQEQFSDYLEQELSSDIYENSRKSQREVWEQQQRQYYSQQINIRCDPPQITDDFDAHHEAKQQKQVAVLEYGVQMQEDGEMPLQIYMERALSPKLYSEKPTLENQQIQFTYPSLMEQSNKISQDEHEIQISQEAHSLQKSVTGMLSLRQNSINNKLVNREDTKNFNPNSQFFQNDSLPNPTHQYQPVFLALPINLSSNQRQVHDQNNVQEISKIDIFGQGAKLRIVDYQKEYFLKIETQVYNIQFCSGKRQYTFNRTFSDFVLLDKFIKHKYPGFILYPIPQNSNQFFNKIKLSVATQLEKAIFIEKRLLELEKYLNFLLTHRQLAASQIFKSFLTESTDQFSREMGSMQKQYQKEQFKFGSSRINQNYKSLKNILLSSLSYFSTFVSGNHTNVQNYTLLGELRRKAQSLQNAFEEVQVQLQQTKLVTTNIQIKAEKLLQIYESNIEMKPIESNIDSVLKLSSKMASSKTAYQLHKSWMQDKMLSKIYFYIRMFAQVQQQVEYRRYLLHKIHLLEEEQTKLGLSIIQRVQCFDARFLKDWEELKVKFQKQYLEMVEQFSTQWRFHCVQMSKVWK